jgi:hypothetical protein
MSNPDILCILAHILVLLRELVRALPEPTSTEHSTRRMTRLLVPARAASRRPARRLAPYPQLSSRSELSLRHQPRGTGGLFRFRI